MPLDEFQREVLRLLAEGRSPHSHLAGGAVLHSGEDSPRFTRDLDIFHDREELVASAFSIDSKRLKSKGCRIEMVLNQPGYIRAVVRRARKSTLVDWAHDSAWRFMPPRRIPNIGYALHPVDISINKILALAGRDEPRDFLDIVYINNEILSLGALCWAACGKDPGYNPTMLVEMLARKGRFRPEDFDRLELAKKVDLGNLKRDWLAALEAAKILIHRLPPKDAGCLYWDAQRGRFVTPESLAKLQKHFASLGGIIPQIHNENFLTSTSQKRAALKRSYGKKKKG